MAFYVGKMPRTDLNFGVSMKRLRLKKQKIVIISLIEITLVLGVLIIVNVERVYGEAGISIDLDDISRNDTNESIDTEGIEIFTERSLEKQRAKEELEEKEEEKLIQSLFAENSQKKTAMEEYSDVEIFDKVNVHLSSDSQYEKESDVITALIYMLYVILVAGLVSLGINISRKFRRKRR